MAVEGPAHAPNRENLYAQILAKTQQHRRLFSAHWELTHRCNARCSHCYLDVLPPDANVPDELTTVQCFRVIDELAAAGVLNLTLSGGEIFVRRDIFTIAQYARARRFLLRLFTNGTLITPPIADRIAALHPYAVEISIYGSIAETHEKITRLPHSFELSTRALRLLHARGVRTVMKTPLMRENVCEFHGLRALAQDLGAQFRYDITITPKDDGSRAPLRHRMTFEDLVWLFRQEIDPTLWASRTCAPGQGTCAIALNALAIDPYGSVFPCMQARIAAGNLRAQSLQEIWEKSPVWEQLRHLTLDALPACRACKLQTLCVRCHGLALVEDGDLRAPARVNCCEALARRQVLVEKGALPNDYPVPIHLREQRSSQVPEFLRVRLRDRNWAAR